MLKIYRFNYFPEKDGTDDIEFEAESYKEAKELFEEYCKTELDGYVPEKVTVTATDDCENTTGYEDNCL